MKGDAIHLAQVCAQIQTAGTAIAAIDAGNGQLDIAEQAVALVPVGYAAKDPFAAGVSWVLGTTQDVQASLRSAIAQARTELAGFRARYRGYTGDDLAEEISTVHSAGIASALAYTNKVLNDCIDEIGDGPTVDTIDLVTAVAQAVQAAIAAVGKAVQSVAQGAANTAAGVLRAFWVPLAIAGGAVLLYLAWTRGAIKVPT